MVVQWRAIFRGRMGGVGQTGVVGVITLHNAGVVVAAVVSQAHHAICSGAGEQETGGAEYAHGIGFSYRAALFGVGPHRVVRGKQETKESFGRPVWGGRAGVDLGHGGEGAKPAAAKHIVLAKGAAVVEIP